MIIYIIAYSLMGLLAGLAVSTVGKIQRWDEVNLGITTVLSVVAWPIVPVVALIIYVFYKLNDLSNILAEKYR
jgi:hypothetical protein